MLLQAGADSGAVDGQKWTPLHACAEFVRPIDTQAGPKSGLLAALSRRRRKDDEDETLRIADIILSKNFLLSPNIVSFQFSKLGRLCFICCIWCLKLHLLDGHCCVSIIIIFFIKIVARI